MSPRWRAFHSQALATSEVWWNRPWQHAQHQLEQGDEERLGHDPQAAGERVADPTGAQPVAHLQAGGDRRSVGGRPSASRWATRAAGATSTRAPATWARHDRSRSSPSSSMPGSKPPSARNRSARTRVDRAGDVEHVAHGVVLLLVELAPLDVGAGRAGLVGAHADLQDAVGRVPLDDLGPDHAGVRAVGLLDHHLDRRRGRGARRRGRTGRTPRPRPRSSTSLAAGPNPTFSSSRRRWAAGAAAAIADLEIDGAGRVDHQQRGVG